MRRTHGSSRDRIEWSLLILLRGSPVLRLVCRRLLSELRLTLSVRRLTELLGLSLELLLLRLVLLLLLLRLILWLLRGIELRLRLLLDVDRRLLLGIHRARGIHDRSLLSTRDIEGRSRLRDYHLLLWLLLHDDDGRLRVVVATTAAPDRRDDAGAEGDRADHRASDRTRIGRRASRAVAVVVVEVITTRAICISGINAVTVVAAVTPSDKRGSEQTSLSQQRTDAQQTESSHCRTAFCMLGQLKLSAVSGAVLRTDQLQS
jgi:hypothetical protein